MRSWSGLTLVVGHELLQGVESVPWGDVEAPVVQGPDLIMFHCIPVLGVVVSHGQRVAPCIGQRDTAQERDLRSLPSNVSMPTPLPDTPVRPPLAPAWHLSSEG